MYDWNKVFLVQKRDIFDPTFKTVCDCNLQLIFTENNWFLKPD